MLIYFLIPEYLPGVATHLKSLRTVIKENFPDIEVKTCGLDQKVNYNLLNTIKNQPSEFIFIGGFDEHIKTVLQNKDKKTKVCLQWCSPISQSDMDGEIGRFIEAWKYIESGLIHNLCLLMENDYFVLNKINPNIKYTPVYLDTNELDQAGSPVVFDKTNCDLFCGVCPRKNIFAQMCALSSFEDLNVHSNYSRVNYEEIAKLILGKRYINHGRLLRQDYLKILKAQDFGMQVSFSESYNYTAAEHMYFKIPVLMSNVSPLVKNLDKRLVVENNTDLNEIQNKIKLLMNKEYRLEKGEYCHNYIVEHNNIAKDILLENISNMLGLSN